MAARSPLAYVLIGAVMLFGLQQAFVPAPAAQLRGSDVALSAGAVAGVLGAPSASFAYQAKPTFSDLEWGPAFTVCAILAVGSIFLPVAAGGLLEPAKTMADVPKSDPLFGAFKDDRKGENPLLKQ
mmetsp:Transcript_12678/g.29784  ORF Transcript_12678/g.29784 Transcript_12678/m.29784 type:complete len:126 (-) Transcript_12678:87-464(-)